VCSTVQKFWATYNFTDYHDGWDHQSDRLGTIIGVADDGRSCEVLRAWRREHSVCTPQAQPLARPDPPLSCPPPSVR